ncbi:MAG TPA: TonB-dependent receptor [Steroidobacteraceae bacterium]|nr:TonB-dependent receptor [Steroidobacteraceae bacterium]
MINLDSTRDKPPVHRWTIAMCVAAALYGALPVSTYASDGAALDSNDSNTAADDDSYGRLQEVVVSARRREENAQSVPIPIAAVGGNELDQTGTIRLEGLNAHLPSMNVEFDNPRQNSIAVRGLGNNPANDALESSVGVYLDNVYLGRAAMANIDLIDIDQVALLRGPQGTLFGKNTTAGVLNITTKLPSFTPEADGEVSIGNLNSKQWRASLTGPLIDGTLAGRLTASRTYQEGFVDDVYDGRKFNGVNRDAIRGQLLWNITSDLNLRLIAEHEEEHSDTGVGILYNPGPNGGTKYFNAVRAAGAVVVDDPNDPQTTIDGKTHMVVHQSGFSGEANWSLGDYKLTSISAWRSWAFVPSNDADNVNVNAFPNGGQAVHDQQLSQELRLASPGDKPLSWVGGLYYFWQQQHNDLYTQYGANATAIQALGLGTAAFANGYYNAPAYLRTESGAAFGQLTWRPSDSWEFAAGIRDTQEGKAMRITRSNNGVSPAFSAAFGNYDSGGLTLNNNTVSALLSASYKFTPDVMTYASLSRGAKAGGINPSVPNGALGVNSLYVRAETAEDAELGIKSSWLNHRVTANANLFWTEVKNYQATLLESVGATNTFIQVLTNIGKVRTRGVETEVTAVPIDGLTLQLSGSYNNAVYLVYDNAPCSSELLAPTNAAQGSLICNLSGKPVVGAPTWVANPGASWTQHLTGSLTGDAEANYSWRSKQFGSADD